MSNLVNKNDEYEAAINRLNELESVLEIKDELISEVTFRQPVAEFPRCDWLQHEAEVEVFIPVRKGLTKSGVGISIRTNKTWQTLRVFIDKIPVLNGNLYAECEIEKLSWSLTHIPGTLYILLPKKEEQGWPVFLNSTTLISQTDAQKGISVALKEKKKATRGFSEPIKQNKMPLEIVKQKIIQQAELELMPPKKTSTKITSLAPSINVDSFKEIRESVRTQESKSIKKLMGDLHSYHSTRPG